MTEARVIAEANYAAAQKVWLAACGMDAATFEQADAALKAARIAVVRAELADPTPREARRHAASRNSHGLETSKRWG